MEKDDLIYLIKAYISSNRPNEAISSMKELIEISPDLNREEYQIFQVVYKQICDAYRETLRTLSLYLDVEKGVGRLEIVKVLEDKKNDIISNLISFCKEAIEIMDTTLIPECSSIENPEMAKAFYIKFKADLYRYISEFSDETESLAALKSAEDYYNEALDIASRCMIKSHPIYLSILLNAAVFQYEQKHDMSLAKSLCLEGIQSLDEDFQTLDETDQESSRQMVTYMRRNIYSWNSNEEEEQQAE
ncbi:14-3-3 protein [Trichomonas vaginalis G3]|uniref:14-3-3 protein n=1 Tax=Trichomonas vaginalis (strain ATCC PRA-98 / G3) TaxID=412133 RepID=A2DQL3_TRIV3|nr:protein domain specific binding [Trichomonas vaginalis G3]EAY17297.1 14-3-3 protein [Trichomonas vaginalis G3]KAI5523298.1 protein domain specific binding [Trichomonas vaginalis G3]|eukprot:XP_001329520.1 14-3-3 protein [Trichomonas vaginalis G3]